MREFFEVLKDYPWTAVSFLVGMLILCVFIEMLIILLVIEIITKSGK